MGVQPVCQNGMFCWDANHQISRCWTLLNFLQSALACHVLKRLEYSQYMWRFCSLEAGSFLIGNAWTTAQHHLFFKVGSAVKLNPTDPTRRRSFVVTRSFFRAGGRCCVGGWDQTGSKRPQTDLGQTQTSNRPQTDLKQTSGTFIFYLHCPAVSRDIFNIGLKSQKMIRTVFKHVPQNVSPLSLPLRVLTSAGPVVNGQWLLTRQWFNRLTWKLEIRALHRTKSDTSTLFLSILLIFIARKN